jgi:RND family efflux transporter MFP subunit
MKIGLPKGYAKPLLVLLVGSFAAYGLLIGKQVPVQQALPKRPPSKVSVISVVPAAESLSVTTQGTVAPRREINIVSQVAGKVISVSDDFASGGFFVLGEQLLELEDHDYQFALLRAKARVADAEQLVALEKGRVRQARREWKDLGNEDANQLFLRKPQLASARASLAAAKADLSEAELNLKRTKIHAPFQGRIANKQVDIGQYITPGTTIAKVYSTDVAEVRLPLTDRQVALLDLPLNYDDGSEIDETPEAIISASFADQTWQWSGKITRTDSSIDVDSRVIYAVAEVEHPFSREAGSRRPPLSIGLFVEAKIAGRKIEDVVVLPRRALRSDGTLLLVDADNRLFYKTGQVLKSDQHKVWLSGLAAGSRVVVSHLPVAVAGMEVSAREVTELAELDTQ